MGTLESNCEKDMIHTMAKRDTLKGTDTLDKLAQAYMNSDKFIDLSNISQVSYEAHIIKALATKVMNGKILGNIKLKDINISHISNAYAQWRKSGLRTANLRAAVMSVMFRLAQQQLAMMHNPVSLLDRKSTKKRKVKWTQAQVKLFLDVAYSNFNYRSIGLIVHMAYEWAQRIGDMRNLQWSSLDLDAQRLDLEQSKRGASVHIPISDSLTAMLRQQHADFGHLPYVAPRVKARAGSYTPYDIEEISPLINQVIELAGLPYELTAMDLRRTAITEMVEAGVDLAGVMQISGHSNPNSVTPYMVNTLTGATTAQNKRWSKRDDSST
jgi:integrase